MIGSETSKQREEPGEDGQDQRADYGPRIAAAPAEDRRAADDHAGDRGQEVAVGEAEIGRVRPPDHDEPGDRRQNRAYEIVGEQDAPDPDAREMARLAIIADRIEKTAEPRPLKAEQD